MYTIAQGMPLSEVRNRRKRRKGILMGRKRKTLPLEIKRLLREGNEEELEKVMLGCLPNAAYSFGKSNIFALQGIKEEFARWLLNYGADINMQDDFGYTPLHQQAMIRDNAEQVELYIRLGAGVNLLSYRNGGPLHGAVDCGCLENVKVLLKYGADIHAKDFFKENPVEHALSRSRGLDVADKLDAIELVMEAGLEITERMKKKAEKIAKDIESGRREYGEETAQTADETLSRLYQLFEIGTCSGETDS